MEQPWTVCGCVISKCNPTYAIHMELHHGYKQITMQEALMPSLAYFESSS